MAVNLHSVLFGFWNKLALHLERSTLSHSYGYPSAADRPTCFASLPQKPNPGETCGLAEILNFVQISPLIATSGQPQEKEFSLIADAGYIAVINLARHDSDGAIGHEAAILAELDIAYHQIPVRFDRPQKKQLHHFILLMKMLEHDKVWVHCALNFRVSVFIYQYLTQACGFSGDQARSPVFDFWQPDTVWQEVLQWSAEDIGLREQ